MNVLILTPDAVGSTLLQRMITIYMQFHQYDKPVINLHELTNGLVKYYNSHFERDLLGKPDSGKWGYYQKLPEVVDLLHSVDHYKTSRLAQYHIKNRQDSIEDQIQFYHYLNENFFIISCRRHNVFEHSLSWAINKITKKLNVYSPEEKITSFYNYYRDKIELDTQSLIQTLESYKNYLKWCEDHFSIASYFYYDEHLPNIEKYILNLPIFAGQPQKLTWNDQFGIEFNDWNKCHYLKSDIGTLALNHNKEFTELSTELKLLNQLLPGTFIESYKNIADESWPIIQTYDEFKNLPQQIQDECATRQLTLPTLDNLTDKSRKLELALPEEHIQFLNQYSDRYDSTNAKLSAMKDHKIFISGPPIKKQTMKEKYFMIKNFAQCLDVYNAWIIQNPSVGLPIDISLLEQASNLEQGYWSPVNQLTNNTNLKTLKLPQQT